MGPRAGWLSATTHVLPQSVLHEQQPRCWPPIAYRSICARTHYADRSFSIKQLATAGAVIITASHNPADYNGVKFRPDYAGAASDEVLAEIQANIARVESGDIPVQRVDLSAATQSGLLRTFDPWPDYFRNIASLVHMDRIRESSGARRRRSHVVAARAVFPKYLTVPPDRVERDPR